MIEHSPRALGVIRDFAASMGLHQVSPVSDGSVTFLLERVGTICFAPTQHGTHFLVSLKRTFADLQFDDLKRFLTLPTRNLYLNISINAGMCVDGSLVLLADFEERDVNLQALEQCVDLLDGLYETWLSRPVITR